MRRRDLDDEERDLWRRAVRDVKPAKRGRAPARKPAAASERGPRRESAPAKSVSPAPALRKSAPKAHRIVGGGDPSLDRRAARGRIAIDATIDLHGLTQAEAHRRLLRFVERAHADDARLLLVITGKGRGGDAPRPGVLKSRFLDWAEEAPLRAIIARVGAASQRDGGAGAFYVFLKSKGAGKIPRL